MTLKLWTIDYGNIGMLDFNDGQFAESMGSVSFDSCS
jgi:hypothetical protein